MIVKNSIHARKTLQRRAKTNKIKKTRSNSESLYLLIFCYIFCVFLGCFFVFWLIHILSFEKRKICSIYFFLIDTHTLLILVSGTEMHIYKTTCQFKNILFFKFQNLVALTLASSYMFMSKVENSVCRRKRNLDSSLVLYYHFPVILLANSFFKIK